MTAEAHILIAADAKQNGPARILVVEDDETVRRVFVRFLGRRYDVVAAQDGLAAIELLEREASFDVIVSDVAMPRLSGPGLLREVEKRWPFLAKRFLLVTGAILESEDQTLIKQRKIKVLGKPIDFSKLNDEIERLLARAPDG